MPNRRRSTVINGDSASAPMLPGADVLRERVYNNERNIFSLQGEVHEIRSTMATQEDVRGLQNSLSSISSKLDTKLEQIGRPQWQAIGVMVTVLVVIGGILYWPIRESSTELKESMKEMRGQLVPRVEHEKEWRRAEMALSNTQSRIEKNQEALVPRDVFVQQTTGIQRQIDEIRRDVGGVVTTRDVLQNTQKQIERLESEMRALASRNGRAP